MKFSQWVKHVSLVFLCGLILLTAAGIIHAAYAAFTWGKFTLSDYGKYTNMIWNCAHGNWFEYLVDHTYLSTHLSFSLVALGPAFLIWDHPFTLSVAQWLLLIAGSFVIWRTAWIHGLGALTTAAIVLFFIANPFTQSVMLCEFHGVSLYFFLVPWLYHCLSLCKRYAWLPVLLILGVREEAGIVIFPMLAYFAVRDRWRVGFFLAALALGYSFFAVTFLFSFINDVAFVQRRGNPLDLEQLRRVLAPKELLARAKVLLGCFFAAVFFLRKRGWIPILVFPLAALAMSASSGYGPIFLQMYHYPAALIVFVTLGILEAVIRSERVEKGKCFDRPRYAALLVAVTLCWHVAKGFLPFGASFDRVYWNVHPDGLAMLEAARHIPKKGILLCQSEWAGFCANRKHLTTWEYLEERRCEPDLVFIRLGKMRQYGERYRAMIQSGKFGVRYCERGYAVLERGYSTRRNREILKGYFGG